MKIMMRIVLLGISHQLLADPSMMLNNGTAPYINDQNYALWASSVIIPLVALATIGVHWCTNSQSKVKVSIGRLFGRKETQHSCDKGESPSIPFAYTPRVHIVIPGQEQYDDLCDETYTSDSILTCYHARIKKDSKKAEPMRRSKDICHVASEMIVQFPSSSKNRTVIPIPLPLALKVCGSKNCGQSHYGALCSFLQ